MMTSGRLLFRLFVLAAITTIAASATDSVMRCKSCGAEVALKSDVLADVDHSEANGVRKEPLLGKHAKVHIFTNQAKNDVEVAPFRIVKADILGEISTKKTMYPTYMWQFVHCCRCKTKLGWYYIHEAMHQCMERLRMQESNDVDRIMGITGDKEQRDTSAKEVSLTKILSDTLANAPTDCLVFSNGWWSYQWCHLKEIRQFHQEPNGRIAMEWSLGAYSESPEVSPELDASAPGTTSHYFVGGQRCDENNNLRETRVKFQCCDINSALVDEDAPFILSIEEPSLCQYVMTICIPGFCKDENQRKISTLKENAVRESCREKFTKDWDGDSTILDSFYGIIWSTVVSTEGQELEWVSKLKPQTSLYVPR